MTHSHLCPRCDRDFECDVDGCQVIGDWCPECRSQDAQSLSECVGILKVLGHENHSAVQRAQALLALAGEEAPE